MCSVFNSFFQEPSTWTRFSSKKPIHIRRSNSALLSFHSSGSTTFSSKLTDTFMDKQWYKYTNSGSVSIESDVRRCAKTFIKFMNSHCESLSLHYFAMLTIYLVKSLSIPFSVMNFRTAKNDDFIITTYFFFQNSSLLRKDINIDFIYMLVRLFVLSQVHAKVWQWDHH